MLGPDPVVIELRHGGWLRLLPGLLSADEADAALQALSGELDWQQRSIVLFGKAVVQPRLIAWAGALPYRYSGQTLEPRPTPPSIAGLLDRARHAADTRFNHVLLNRYRSGQDSMGMHADDEPELGPDPVVATLSLGAERRFVLAPRRGARQDRQVLALPHGSLLIMGGSCQRFYRHGVPRTAAPVGERVSLTFRKLLRAPS